MSSPSSLSSSAAMSKHQTRQTRSTKKAYLLIVALAFVLELILALSVSSTGKDMLQHLGIRQAEAIPGSE